MERKIGNLVYPVTMWWAAFFVSSMVLYATAYPMDSHLSPGRANGWTIKYLPLSP